MEKGTGAELPVTEYFSMLYKSTRAAWATAITGILQ